MIIERCSSICLSVCLPHIHPIMPSDRFTHFRVMSEPVSQSHKRMQAQMQAHKQLVCVSVGRSVGWSQCVYAARWLVTDTKQTTDRVGKED